MAVLVNLANQGLLRRRLPGSSFFPQALFDRSDCFAYNTIKHSRLLQNRLRFRRPWIVAYLRNCANVEVSHGEWFKVGSKSG